MWLCACVCVFLVCFWRGGVFVVVVFVVFFFGGWGVFCLFFWEGGFLVLTLKHSNTILQYSCAKEGSSGVELIFRCKESNAGTPLYIRRHKRKIMYPYSQHVLKVEVSHVLRTDILLLISDVFY